MKAVQGKTPYQSIPSLLDLAGRISFAITIVLIPARFNWLILERLRGQLHREFTDFYLFAVDVALLATLTLWVASIFISQRKLTLGPLHIWIPLAGLTLAGWISAISSFDPVLSIYHAIRLFALFWFYVYIVNEIKSVVWVIIPVGLQILVQSILALAQFISQRSMGLYRLGEKALEPASSGVSIVAANGVRLLRAYGLTDHPNILGGCLAFGLVLIISAYLHIQKPIPILIIFILAFPALLSTFSRSAWLAYLGGFGILILIGIIERRRETMKKVSELFLLSALVLTPFLFFYAGFFGARINVGNTFNSPSVEQQSIGERFLLIKSSLPILIDHPFFGVGLGASTVALKVYNPDFPVAYEPPHIALFDATLETGIFGAVFYSALLLSPLIIIFKHRKLLSANILTSTTIALLISINIVGVFDYYTWFLIPGRLWQWLAWGLWAASSQNAIKSMPLPVTPPIAKTV